MKRLIAIAFSSLAIAVVAAPASNPVPVKHTPEEIARRRAIRAQRFYEMNGGYVRQQVNGKVVRIVNTSSRLDNAAIDAGLGSFRANLDLPVEVVTSAIEANPSAYLKDNVGFVVALVDSSDAPSILAAPENAWASVNVARLYSDDAKLFNRRVVKEIWRAAAFALGAGYAIQPNDLMNHIRNLDDLDRIPADSPCPASYNIMIETANRLGIRRVPIVTYRQACQEGWAPAPTNAVQQAIWDKVRTLPAEPMKIEFDPKKGR